MAASPTMIGQVLGHYRLLEQIGQGGMGIVYRAQDEQLDREVAVKVLPSDVMDVAARKRFRKEALAVAKLNHPNVATIHEFGTQGSTDFLVTEYVHGLTLDAKLAAGPLPEKELLRLGTQLAEGLEAAHQQGIVHCDLKPGNLRVTPSGQLKILDFGMARLFNPSTEPVVPETVSNSNIFRGTVPYMSPEQLRGDCLDKRCDIWASGAVLYEMATGRSPFTEKLTPRLMDAILHDTPPAPRAINARISPQLEQIVLKALDKDPDRRYQSSRELCVDLNRLITASDSTHLVSESQRQRHLDAIASRSFFSRAAHSWKVQFLLAIVFLLGIWIGFHNRHRILPGSNSPRQRLLAVLPFTSIAKDEETTALGAGMSETLTAKLSQLSNANALQLVSIREMEAQRISTADEARREFGVDLVLEGSLQHFGDMVRINCILVDPQTHRQLRATTITAAANDIFGLEDRVVDEAIAILKFEVEPEQRRRLQERYGISPPAYEHYLRGRGYLEEYQKTENIQSAIMEFKKAIEFEPTYGQAYAALGETYWRASEQRNSASESLAMATASCQKALKVAPGLPEANVCLGNVFNSTGKYDEGLRQFQLATSQEPNNEDAFRGLANSYEMLGKLTEAEAVFRKLIALRPNYWAVYNWLGTFYYRHARYNEAAEMFGRVIELAPDNFRGHSNLGGMYIALGRYQDAISELKRSIEIRPTPEAYTNLGSVYFSLKDFPQSAATFQNGLKLDEADWLSWGNLADALYWIPNRRAESVPAYERAITLGKSKLKLTPKDGTLLAYIADYQAMLNQKNEAARSITTALELSPADAEVKFRAAIVYAHIGTAEQMLSSLEKAVAAGYSLTTIRDTPDFDDLRQDERFQKAIRKP
ncbi:MAG: protein kinase [Acidobacteriota bacterium]|nr:protein kinase [Acidobacteriota bacterium]